MIETQSVHIAEFAGERERLLISLYFGRIQGRFIASQCTLTGLPSSALEEVHAATPTASAGMASSNKSFFM